MRCDAAATTVIQNTAQYTCHITRVRVASYVHPTHAGVHELSCYGRPLLLVNTLVGPDARPSPYAALAPPVEAIFTAGRFRRAVERLGPEAGRGLCSARRSAGST